MSYVAYHKESTRLLSRMFNNVHRDSYATEAAAKAAITRVCNQQVGRVVEDYAVADTRYFYAKVEKKETVQNLMSGRDVVQGVNTPLCCDPSSETYWSM